MENRVALMIDAENVGYKYIDDIVREIAKYGRLIIARFYGDVNSISSQWRTKALDYAIKPMHQYNIASGKNSADMEMTIDTLELKYQNKADIFFIVSSDSDFMPLAIKLKELGAIVIGIGDENKVTSAYKNSCTEFKYFQYFDQDDKNPNETTIEKDNIKFIIENIIIENSENNILQLSRLGDILIKQYSDFDPRKYGSSNLTSLVEKLGFATSIENTTRYVKLNLTNDIEEIKHHIEKYLSNNKKGNISEIKISICEKFKDFNEKKYGASKFSNFLKQLGYTIKGNYFNNNNAV